MNVTDQVLRSHIKYGGSDNTNPSGLSASYSLNYAKGGSITNPDRSSLITHIPFTLNFKDAVGLFGAENYYHRVDLDLPRDRISPPVELVGLDAQFGHGCLDVNFDIRVGVVGLVPDRHVDTEILVTRVGRCRNCD